MVSKMKSVGWFEKPRAERLAQVLYPHLSDEASQKQMLDTAGDKRASLQQRINQGSQMYGKVVEPPVDYSKVPGLKHRSK